MCSVVWAQSTPATTLSELKKSPLTYLKGVKEARTPSNTQHLVREQHLPFFCAAEAKWDKKSKTKMRFRLGSQEYVDRLEGKLDK